MDLGFETPAPIGYIELCLHGIFHTGYYICLYSDYKPIGELLNLDFYDENPQKIGLLKRFITSAAKLSNASRSESAKAGKIS